ncbi:MAG: toll/interleukin-1 receptor domain-containing protein [Myxococcales bacterium]|nr:toll/interleukin-1 receptor domain-containing protein [Myxococcales bacterium]
MLFLAHNSLDKPVVRDIVEQLKLRGVPVWYDEAQLAGGYDWVGCINQAIDACTGYAVCFGRHPMGPVQAHELSAILATAMRNQRPVVPVLLPGAKLGAEDLPAFLRARTWVSLDEPGWPEKLRDAARNAVALRERRRLLDDRPLELTVRLVPDGGQVQITYASRFSLNLSARATLPGFVAPTDGPGLFNLLFPDAPTRHSVFQRLTEATGEVPPDRHPVRLRVWTEDPDLARAPWHRLSWQGTPLVWAPRPWTVEVVQAIAGEGAAPLSSPARLLVCVPPDLAGYGRHLRDALAARLPVYDDPDGPLTVVTDPGQLAAAWRAARPQAVHLVDVVAPLQPLLAAHCPTVIYLTGSDPLEARAAPLALGDAHLPADERLAVARGFWRAVLTDGAHPVAVASHAGLSAFTRFDAWQADRVQAGPQGVPSHRRLDRFRWRSAVYERVAHLIASRARRVAGLVFCGEPDHRLDALSELLETHLKQRGKREFLLRRVAVACPVRPAFEGYPDAEQGGPAWRAACDDFRAALEVALRDALGAAAVDGAALRGKAPPAAGGRAPVLWLDYGLMDDQGVQVEDEHIQGWLSHVRRLAPVVPGDLSVLCTLGVLSANAEWLEGVPETVDGFAPDLHEQFGLYGLPPLAHVTLTELRDYFSEAENEPTLDRGQAARAARVLFDVTGGNYRLLVERIEEGRRQGWLELLDRLDPPDSAPKPRRRSR